jgi:hypothetical protein
VGEKEFILGNAVVCHQESAGKSLFELSLGIGQGRIARLYGENMGKAEKRVLKSFAFAHGSDEGLGFDTLTVPFDLDEDLTR